MMAEETQLKNIKRSIAQTLTSFDSAYPRVDLYVRFQWPDLRTKYVQVELSVILLENCKSLDDVENVTVALNILTKYASNLLSPLKLRPARWNVIDFLNPIFNEKVHPIKITVELMAGKTELQYYIDGHHPYQDLTKKYLMFTSRPRSETENTDRGKISSGVQEMAGEITCKEQQELINCIDRVQYAEAHEAYIDLQEAGINVKNSVKYEESSGNVNTGIHPVFPRNPSQVSDLNEIESASVEDDNESSFKSVYDAGGQGGVKDVPVSECFAKSVVESKPKSQEEKSLLKETTLPSDVQKGCKKVLKWFSAVQRWHWADFMWFSMLLFCCTWLMAQVTHTLAYLPSIELIWQVPQSNHSRWLLGRKTIQRNEVKEGNISLKISNQEIEDYDCEIRLPTGNQRVLQFPLKVFSCCALAENEDLSAFKEGKKSVEVELNGKAITGKTNVTKRYLFRMQIQTLQIYFEQGTDIKLKPVHVQCKATLKEIGNEGTNVEVGGKEQSSEIGKIVGIVFGAGVVAILLCLVSWYRYMVKRRSSPAAQNQDEEAGTPALDLKPNSNSSSG